MRYRKHRNVLLSLLIAFSLFSCYSSSSPYYIRNTTSMASPDKHTQALKRRIANLESKMGIHYYEFQYYIPGDRKLIVTMKAGLNGEILPKMSGHFHISPPTDSKTKNKGLIGIRFYDPPFQSKESIKARCVYLFSLPAHSHSHRVSIPTELPAISSWSVGIVSQDGLKANQEYNVLDLDGREDNESGSAAESKRRHFRLNMSIRIASLDDYNARDKVTRVEL